MGPPPPKENGTWWQRLKDRWRYDKREAKEINMPTNESSREWKVRNVVS